MAAQRPYAVAVTGGIASGKSAVCARLAELGATLVDADVVAREVVAPGQPALAEIRAAFGDAMIAADGALDRARMRRHVFADPAERIRLEAILHPRIRTRMRELAAKAPEGDPLRKQVGAFAEKVDAIRKEIVATKEGGAITGEERLREKLDNVYGAIVFYEGAPGPYQLATVDALQKEMDGVSAEFDSLVATDLPKVNAALKAKGAPEIQVPPAQPVAESPVSSADINAAFAAWAHGSFGLDLDRGTDVRERD